MAQEDRTTGLVGFSGMKVPVRLATTANLTLSGEQTIDGVAAVTGDRVLVKDQTDQTENGIYVVDTGDWNRAADCDGPYDLVQGSVVYVNAGSTNTGFWYCTSANPVDIESDNITWARASSVLAAVSAFVQTLLDDADAAAFFDTLVANGTASTLLAKLTTEKLALTGDISPTQITASQNDYNPTGLSTATVLRLSTDASRNITGIQGGADGRILKLLNVGSFPIVLKTANTGSSAANRFDFDTDLTLQPDQGVILYYDSTDSRWRAARTTNGEFRSVQVYTSTGANTWTKPAGIKRAKVTVVAGGGNGANVGGAGAGQVTIGGGGAGAGTSIKTIEAASLGATETATVGAANGSSSFGTHCSATGGANGTAGGTGAYSASAGSLGGVGTGGDINIRGGSGYPGYGDAVNVNVMSGGGGTSYLGGGAPALVAATGNGTAAGTYGGGGSGAISYNGSGAANGGAGAPGIIIVEELF